MSGNRTSEARLDLPVYEARLDLPVIPRRLQTQRALNDQLRDLQEIANRLGLYDAADLVQDLLINRH